jgi:regulator of sigma E protease
MPFPGNWHKIIAHFNWALKPIFDAVLEHMEVLDILVKAAQFTLSLSILIILHEMGHFIPARIFGIRVEKFYLFFDPWFSLVKKKIGDTEYGVGWLPLGGYVKISGMIDESMDKEQMKQPVQPWEFRAKPAWQRLIVMIGGVVVNIILGILIYAGTLYAWGEEYLPTENLEWGVMVDSTGEALGLQNGDRIITVNSEEVESFSAVPMEIILGAQSIEVERDGEELSLPITDEHIKMLINSPNFLSPRIPYLVGDFSEGSVAESAGLQKEDQFIALNGTSLVFFDEYVDQIAQYAGQEIEVSVLRDGDTLHYSMTLGEDGKMGVYAGLKEEWFEYEVREYGVLESIPAGYRKATSTLNNYVRQFKHIFNPDTEAYKSVGGFLTIGSQFPSSWDWRFFWNFTAFLSIMLAFLNILPIPALDGGHVIFTLWELITGRKPSEKVLEYAQIAGFIILLGLLIFANGNDIRRFFF